MKNLVLFLFLGLGMAVHAQPTVPISPYSGRLFNVMSYGAKGGAGTNDDGPAIQRTIDAAARLGGGIVYFPVGAYGIRDVTTDPGWLFEACKAPIRITTNNIVLLGEDMYGTTITSLAPTGAVRETSWVMIGAGPRSGTVGFTNVGIENLTIDGGYPAGTGWYDCIEWYYCTNEFFKNVRFLNIGPDDAIDVQYGGATYIEGCRFQAVQGNHISTQNSYVVVRNCDFNANGHANSVGVIESPATAIEVLDSCVFHHVGGITTNTSMVPLRTIVKNCKFYVKDGTSPQFRFGTASVAQFQDCIWFVADDYEDGSWGPAQLAPAIQVDTMSILNISGCTFNQYVYPMKIALVTSECRIFNNSFNGSGALEIKDGTSGYLITGNTFSSSPNGVRVTGGTEVSNLRIMGNIFTATPNPGVLLDVPGTNNVINGNTFFGSGNLMQQTQISEVIVENNNAPGRTLPIAGVTRNVIRGNKIDTLSVAAANPGLVENNLIKAFGGSGGNYNTIKTNRNRGFDMVPYKATDDQ